MLQNINTLCEQNKDAFTWNRVVQVDTAVLTAQTEGDVPEDIPVPDAGLIVRTVFILFLLSYLMDA